MQWASNVAFAEVAEALKINTDQVMSTFVNDEVIVVIYTAEYVGDVGEQTTVYVARCVRDGDSILRQQGPTMEMQGLDWDDLARSMRQKMRELGYE